jgi:hypothetical protein
MTTVVLFIKVTGNQHPVILALYIGGTVIWGRVPKTLGILQYLS